MLEEPALLKSLKMIEPGSLLIVALPAELVSENVR